MYKKEDIELLLFKIDSEGLDYALTEYGDGFEGTLLGDKIDNYKTAADDIEDELDKIRVEMGIGE